MKLKISEQDFLNSVVELAHLMHWKVHHSRPAWTEKGYRTAIQGDAGFPDLILVRPPRVIIVELKSEKGKLTAEQESWIKDLEGCEGVDVDTWYPDDWDAIKGILL